MTELETDITYVENKFVRMAYVYTDDPKKVGTIAWYGPNQVCVGFVFRPDRKETIK